MEIKTIKDVKDNLSYIQNMGWDYPSVEVGGPQTIMISESFGGDVAELNEYGRNPTNSPYIVSDKMVYLAVGNYSAYKVEYKIIKGKLGVGVLFADDYEFGDFCFNEYQIQFLEDGSEKPFVFCVKELARNKEFENEQVLGVEFFGNDRMHYMAINRLFDNLEEAENAIKEINETFNIKMNDLVDFAIMEFEENLNKIKNGN